MPISIQVPAWDRHNNVAGLNQLMACVISQIRFHSKRTYTMAGLNQLMACVISQLTDYYKNMDMSMAGVNVCL